MPRNPFEKDKPAHETKKGEDILNNRKERVVRIRNQDGSYEDILVSVRETRPDSNGNYVDTELICDVRDPAGNPFPEDLGTAIRSGEEYWITSRDQLGICTSRLHPRNRSRNILLGHDGRETQNGAICTYCDYWHTTFYIAFAIIGIGVLAGLCKAAGIF
jgi:hypothetical protein